MAELLLRGQSIGTFKGVLFDKDGTLSHSEPQLVKLADDRIDQALERWKGRSQSGLSGRELEQRLRRAFGRLADGLDPAGKRVAASPPGPTTNEQPSSITPGDRKAVVAGPLEKRQPMKDGW